MALPLDKIIQKRPVYHGTNTKFDKLDFNKGGGFVHFAEKPEIAWRYANDLGSGGRSRKGWKDVRVDDLDNGISFTYDPESKLWLSSDGKEAIEFEEFQNLMDEGERYFEAYPKDARVISGKVDASKILDTYPDRTQPYYNRANKKGLEGFLDIVDSSKIENKVTPEFTPISKRYVDKLKRAAEEELKNIPGTPGFGNTFWSTTKWAKSNEINQALQGVSDQLKNAGYDAIKFADDSHPTIAVMKHPEAYLDILKNRTGKTLKSLAPIVKPLVPAASVLGALGYSDIAGAATDAVVPGGVEELGVADERAISDPKYKEYIKRMQERKTNASQKR